MNFNKILNKLVGRIKDNIFGMRYLEYIVANKEKDETVFVVSGELGDIVYGLSLIDSYKKAHPDEKIVIYGTQNRDYLLKTYNVDKVIYFDKSKSETLHSYFISPIAAFVGQRHRVINTCPWYYFGYRASNNIETIFHLKKDVYKLPQTANLTYHRMNG